MADSKRCFIQFPHPGPEHLPKPKDAKCIEWNQNTNEHKRKFMQVSGSWITKDNQEHSGDLWMWGEWEPQSKLLDRNGKLEDDREDTPKYLWQPKLKQPLDNDYTKLHNTDPYVFGNEFVYSNCRRKESESDPLKHLEKGTVIAYGSGKQIAEQRAFVIDTVFVVGDSFDCDSSDLGNPDNGDKRLSRAFIEAVGKPLASGSSDGCGSDKVRIYFGATPSNTVNGVFSFFPATPASSKRWFPRLAIQSFDEDYIRPSNWRGLKGASRVVCENKIKDLWSELRDRTIEAGLVLGTNAKEPLVEQSTD